MKYQSKDLKAPSKEGDETFKLNQTHLVMQSSLTETLDSLVEYLVDNEIDGIHPLIMGEIEKRLIIKVLERSRGNKLRAAKSLGMSRNTFHRKVLKLQEMGESEDGLDS
ncbi:MAG: helix-turn-helix domain-containing protein [Desulfomonilaceae bacterium]